MIGSFWNLCRACPSMPVDKLHSEYRSTYRWHEYTGNPRPEVVRKPPVLNHFGPINEPPLPRRKKCPELAYKTHEFIGVSDTTSNTIVTRARSEERGIPSRRSKSEGPSDVADVMIYKNEIANGFRESSKQAGESNGLFKKTISKLSTEYRLQFVWPQVRRAIKGPGPTNDNATDYPRKSLSMNAIKSSHSNVMPTVHKKRTTKEKEATLFELEPLVNGIESTGKKSARQMGATDGEKMTLSNSQNFERERPNQFITKKENFGFCDSTILEGKNNVNNMGYSDEWYKEVQELRKKADEYKCRGWGIEINPDLYKKQKELWDQVSKRSSLSALSLASSVHRPISKEEKDKENNKKSSFQIKPFSKVKVPGHIYPVENKVMPDGRILPVRVQTIRHHLERTTGPDVEEGALLPSPTREKLMPAIPKEKDIDSYNSQKSSPKKKDSSRHGSPQKSSPQKGSPKKIAKGRSQSVGPIVAENESPKRKIRSVSTAPAPLKTAKSVTSATDKQSKSFDKESEDKDVVVSFKNNTAQIVNETAKQIVKSPPEPTRVKSPEQILMRSPDPVNWTVPLDTGKTFTVTQNVKDGEFYNRPQSEAKASTPVERPPPAPQSAPPELTEQSKMEETVYTTSLY